jgi:hypothetical protein
LKIKASGRGFFCLCLAFALATGDQLLPAQLLPARIRSGRKKNNFEPG